MTGRFAPTPSGRMHIGNVYAMLGAWLSARSRGDRMLMRIEDVDKPRVAAGADQLMMDDLHWLGLDWDGEPMFQSQRTERYEYALECLRSQGVLYPCFCSRADIRAASAPNEGDGFMVYPGTCRRLLHDHPDEVRARLVRGDQHSIRIAMPESAAGEKQRTVPDDSAALSGAVPPERQGDAGIVDGVACFNDRVYSPQHYDLAREVGDSVIRRADGLFGYQLVVVVDAAEFFDDESIDEEPSKFEKWLEAKFGSEKLNRMILGLSTVIGIALPVGLFLLLPSFLGGFVPKDWGVLARNVLEGIVRIAIFLMFMWSVSHMKDIRRTFEYHGAEHKTIFCYEAGEELTVENVRKQGRFHPRCGTSFMFVLIIIATIVSSIVFSIIDITNPFLRMLAHLILLPLVVGISYEFNRYAGRSESVISRALRWPGLMIQHLTVFEPDDSMIEVAITAMKEVIPDDGSDEW